jgi:tetratricopeptide (TPR) repeat protein
MIYSRSMLALLALCAAANTAVAVDTVYLRSADKRVAGEITEVSRESVTVKPRIGDATSVPANDIDRIDWDSQPPTLGLARSKEQAGQYELALEDYRKAQSEAPADNQRLRADIGWGIASTLGRMALADPARQDEAIRQITAFRDGNPDHYRYFDALLLLGDVQLAKGDGNAAEGTFSIVADAKWPDYQMAAKVNIGRVQLARDDVAAARATFDEVAGMNASSPAEQSRKFEAMLGQASCMQQQGQHAEAAQILGEIIQKCAPSATRLQAEAYLRQGDAFAAQGQQIKQAVMAYLHVDLIPSLAREKDLHAEALYRLSQLLPAIGKPADAEIAANRLQSEYPNSSWARKLAGG